MHTVHSEGAWAPRGPEAADDPGEGMTVKMTIASVLTAAAASACCLGPVVLSAVGAGALGAAASRWEPYRPFFIGLTLLLLGAAFRFTHRSTGAACARDGTCAPKSRRAMKIVLWVATALVILLITLPYYVGWFV